MKPLESKQRKFVRGNFLLLAVTLGLCILAVWALLHYRFFVARTGKIERKRLVAYLAAAFGPLVLSQLNIRLPKRYNALWRGIYLILGIVLGTVAFQGIAWQEPIVWEVPFRWITLSLTACLFVAAWVLLGDVRRAVPVMLGLLVVGAYGYRCVFQFRGVTVAPADFLALRTALNVAGNYRYTFLPCDWFYACLTGFFLVAGSWLPHERPRGRIVRLGKWLCASLCGEWMALLLCTPFLTELGAGTTAFHGYAGALNCSQGSLTTFMLEWKNLLDAKPANATLQHLRALEEEMEALSPLPASAEKKPHIFVIVNESFCDPARQLGLCPTMDPMPFLHGLEHGIQGTLYVSAFGGSTCNTEHSFLTGTIPPPDLVTPLFSSVQEETPSLAYTLGALGYTTIAMHPSAPENYQRETIYPLLGFERFLSRNDFSAPERIRQLITDRACYEKAIELYEARGSGETLFCYILTIQNHGGYSIGGVPGPVKVEGRTEGEDEATAAALDEREEYMNLIYQSDAALAMLVEYFERQDEPVLLLFFGDHQPQLKGLPEQRAYEGATQQAFSSQCVPFWLWANWPMESREGVELSVNYLSTLLLETAGLPLSRYDVWLQQMEREYPVVLQMGYADATGRASAWGGSDTWPEALQKLNLARYNRLGKAEERLPELGGMMEE